MLGGTKIEDWDDDDTHQRAEDHDYGEVDDTSLRWVTLWESYLRVHSHLIPDVDREERLQDRLSDIRRELLPDEDDPENLHRNKGDDWMDAVAMAGVVGARDDGVDETWDIDHDCAGARTRFSPEDIASGSTFINVQRQQAGGGPPDNRGVPVTLPSQLNQRQRFAYEIVRAHKDGLGEREPLRMMVLETAGTGKSWLVSIARSHVEAGTRHRVRLPVTWRMLLDGESLIPAWRIGGRVMWLCLSLSYFLIARSDEIFASSSERTMHIALRERTSRSFPGTTSWSTCTGDKPTRWR